MIYQVNEELYLAGYSLSERKVDFNVHLKNGDKLYFDSNGLPNLISYQITLDGVTTWNWISVKSTEFKLRVIYHDSNGELQESIYPIFENADMLMIIKGTSKSRIVTDITKTINRDLTLNSLLNGN